MFRKLFFSLNLFAFGVIVGAFATKRVDQAGGLGIEGIFTSFISQESSIPPIPSTKEVRTTAYCHLENEPGAVGDLNCLGTKLRYDTIRSAAADWSVYPVGTQFRIVGEPHLYEIDDYGSGLLGTETIDLYKPTLEKMNEWGVRHVEIEFVKWGSYQRAAEVMSPRLDYPHVAEMYRKVQPHL